MQPRPFIKIGSKIINPAQITAVDLSADIDGEEGVEISLSIESSIYLYGSEADIARKYFLSGGRAYDLDEMYS